MSLNLILNDFYSPWMLLFYYFKTKKVLKLLKTFEERLYLDLHNYNYIQLLKLLLFVLFFAHVIACLWIYTTRFNPHENWILKDSIPHESIYDDVNK
jgi:hypothetical protein